VRVVYSPRYDIDLGSHVYPTSKYRLIADALVSRVVVTHEAFVVPDLVSWDRLALTHTRLYLDKLRDGRLSVTESARLEIPWSPVITDEFRLMTGGTLTAARLALDGGVVCHVGGGFHHAYAGHGEGFCMFNDVAVAIRVLECEAAGGRCAVIDCDVHHGNGTAAIFADDASVFTCSLHQLNNYPTDKPPSSLDVGFADGTADGEYLARLADALPEVLAHQPRLLFYLAGADPYELDQLGGLSLTKEGLRARDRMVLDAARDARIPVIVVLAGGYARDVRDTVDIHLATIAEAAGSVY
jgi:acetoin utilization deacetylase AcuC-like enzyme